MTQITLVLPYPISANRYWASRVYKDKATGKWMAMTYVTPEAKAYKLQVAALMPPGAAKITGRCLFEIFLFPNRPQDWKTRQRKLGAAWDDTVLCMDLGNCEKVLSDALQGVAIEDDKWIREMVLIRMEPDEHGARAVVRITALTVDTPQLPIDLPGEAAAPLQLQQPDDEPAF